MSKAIPLDLLIDVTSAGVRDTFSLGKLPTILIEKANPLLPNEEFTRVLRGIPEGAGIAKTMFGNTSDVAKFSEIYFGVTAKGASKADVLWVYNWAENGQAETLKGFKVDDSVYALSGDFGIKIGATVENFTVDLTNENTFSGVATALQTEIRTSTEPMLSSATVTYSPITKGFVLTLGVIEEYNAEIVAGTANDIHDKLGLTELEGVKRIAFISPKTFGEALTAIGNENGEFYCITPNFQLIKTGSVDEIKEFGNFIHGSNDRFLGVYSWKNKQLEILGSGATELYEGYNGLLIDYQLNDFQGAFICGLIASINLSLVAGNENLAFQDNTIFQTKALADATAYTALKENKANAPSKFGILGQDDTIYQTGTILGNKTSSANVYLCNSYLKFALQIALYNMFKSQKLISLRGKGGFNIIASYMNEVFNNAVRSNIIVAGAELTTTEQNSAITNFPDNAETALRQLSEKGYYFEVNRIDTVTKEMYITQAYMANMPVSKIIINSYILGA